MTACLRLPYRGNLLHEKSSKLVSLHAYYQESPLHQNHGTPWRHHIDSTFRQCAQPECTPVMLFLDGVYVEDNKYGSALRFQ